MCVSPAPSGGRLLHTETSRTTRGCVHEECTCVPSEVPTGITFNTRLTARNRGYYEKICEWLEILA